MVELTLPEGMERIPEDEAPPSPFDLPEGMELIPEDETPVIELNKQAPVVAPASEGFGFQGDVDTAEQPTSDTPESPFNPIKKVTERFFGVDVDDPLQLERMGTVAGGSILLGNLGGKVPPLNPFINPITGTLFGSAVGAGLGVVAPETTLEMMEFFGLAEEGTRDRVGLSPTELQTVLEGELLLDIATGGGFSLARGGTRLFGQFVTGSGKKSAQAVAKQAHELFGIDLAPVQVGNRLIARGIVNVMGRFPFIGSKLRATSQKTEDALRKSFIGLGTRVGVLQSDSMISNLIYKDGRALLKAVNDYFDKRYIAVYERAASQGVMVRPRELAKKHDELMAKLVDNAPTNLDGEKIIGPVSEKVVAFLKKTTKRLQGTQTTGGQSFGAVDEALGKSPLPGVTTEAFADMSLKQLDKLTGGIDEFMAGLEKSEQTHALGMMKQLKDAALKDMLTNVNGPVAAEITGTLRALDQEFSFIFSEIFETSAAKNFGNVRRTGIKGIAFDEATRTPIDQLSKTILKLDSPQAIEQLSRLVTPETMKKIAAKAVDDAVQGAWVIKDGTIQGFSSLRFAKSLGLDGANKTRQEGFEALLDLTGSSLKMPEIKALVNVSKVLEGLKITPASTFLQRKAVIGGLTGFIRGMLPGIALAGGSSWLGGFFGMAVFIGGGKMISRIISDPRIARPLREVMSKEAPSLVKKKAVIQALRLASASVIAEDGLKDDIAQVMTQSIDIMAEMYDREIKGLEGGDNN